MKEEHPLQPIYDKNSKVLILGSFPSVLSRENMFYYAHPQNRFWKIFEHLYQVTFQNDLDKKEFLLSSHIALWDVIKSCDIKGSSDSSIHNVIANDLSLIIQQSQIDTIITNGKKAHELYQKYCVHQTGIEDICLPSTSPANAMYNLDKLITSYKIILERTHFSN